jgi:hypothetical protein
VHSYSLRPLLQVRSNKQHQKLHHLNSVRIIDVFNGDFITPHKYTASAALTSGQVTTTTAAEYPNEVWVFLAASVEYNGVSSTLKLYVNDAQVGVTGGTGKLVPAPDYYLNGTLNNCI